MVKIGLFIFLNFLFLSVNAQEKEKDTALIISTAKQDAKNFRYDKANKKAVIQNLHNPNSDYFKPTPVYASQSSLLSDSVYVHAFKSYALKKTRSRRTTKTLLFIGGGAIVFLGIIVAAAVSAGPGLPNY